MKKRFSALLFSLLCGFCSAQTLEWATHVDTSTTFSSPRCVDLSLDGVKDIVIGGGLDGSAQTNGVCALDGATGAKLWSFHTNEEIFASAKFQDINSDNIPDVFIGGRYAEFYAIDGATGNMIWEFFPYSPTVSVDSGWFNFYSPQFIPDQNSDGYMDILVANGGNHALPAWDTLRDPGMLVVIDALTGSVLAKDTMPDGEETYCSPVVYDFGFGLEVVFGSGGENDGGSLWRVLLSDLMANDISGATQLAIHPDKGYIAPPSIADINWDGKEDIIAQCYGGEVQVFDGITSTLLWQAVIPNTESSAAPVIGDFIGTKHPDVFATLAKGAAPSFFDYYQVLIDGETGNIVWIDSLSDLNMSSANAVDLDLNGRDEVIVSLNTHNGSYFEHQLFSIDFQNDIIAPFYTAEPGVNLGSSPLVEDIDGDGYLDVVFAYRADSMNPMGQKGYDVRRLSTNYSIPGTGVAWGGYMGTDWDGLYTFNYVNCGSINPGVTMNNISCNGFADGNVSLNPAGGVPPYNFLWSTGEITDSIGGQDVGSVEVIVLDSTGCGVQQTFNFTDPYLITFGGLITPTCPGDSNGQVQVNSSGCPCMFSGCGFDWSSGDSTKVASNLSAGWYTVTITHLDGCIVIDSTEVPEAYPILDSAHVFDQTCATDTVGDGMIDLFLHDAPNTNQSWSNGEFTEDIDSLLAGMYIVDLADTRGCASTDTFYVVAPDTLLVSYNSTDVLCYGDSTGSITAPVTGGVAPYSYQWSNGDTTTVAADLPAGTYSVDVTDSLGCTANSGLVFILEPSSPLTSSPQVWHDSTGNCDGAAQANVTGGVGGYSYSWSPTGGNSNTASNLCDGIYIVIVTDANGCQITDSVEVLYTVGIQNDVELQLKVYPNPSDGLIQLELDSNTPVRYRIFNAVGKVVGKGTVVGRSQIDLSDAASGFYTLEVEVAGVTRRERLQIFTNR